MRTDLSANHDGEQTTKTYVLKSAGIDPAHASRYEAIAANPEKVKAAGNFP